MISILRKARKTEKSSLSGCKVSYFSSNKREIRQIFLASEEYHQSTKDDVEHGIRDGGAEYLAVLALHIASSGSDGDALGTDHLATRGTRRVGSDEPVALTSLHAVERALGGHAQLVSHMSLEFGKEDVGRSVRPSHKGANGTNQRSDERIEVTRDGHHARSNGGNHPTIIHYARQGYQ